MAQVISYGGIDERNSSFSIFSRTLVVVFELLEEMVAWRCRNGRFNEQFQILPFELKVKFI